MIRWRHTEINKYCKAVEKIEAGDKSGLKYLYDSYSASVGACVLERTHRTEVISDIICAFYTRIWTHTEEFHASSNDEVVPYLQGKMWEFLNRRTCPKCGELENIYTVTDLETPDMSIEEMERFDKELEEKKLCYGPDDKTYYCKACDIYY